MEVITIPAKGSRTGVWYKCDWCGKEKYINTYHYNKVKHHFCSYECANAYRRADAYEHRVCEICKKDMYVSKKSAQRFCSDTCQCEWQKTRKGINNPRFTQIEIVCNWCGKKYYESKYKINAQSHFFCSIQCRQDWYANVWSQQPEWKEKSRVRAVKNIEQGLMASKQSKPQLILNRLLDNRKIRYENEYNIKYYSVDNYLTDYNLFIEVMGDYWHCNPIKYSNIEYEHQRETIRRDKAKRTYIMKKYHTAVLYLWETDLVKNQKLCEALIENFINKNGILINYDSFNYHLENEDLCLNKQIISSYIDLSKDKINQKICLAS